MTVRYETISEVYDKNEHEIGFVYQNEHGWCYYNTYTDTVAGTLDSKEEAIGALRDEVGE